MAYIAALILWRYEEVMDRSKRILWDVAVGQKASGQGQDKMFWRELWHKQHGLFSGNDMVDCDPMALVRHPWALKENEFKGALASMQDGTVPAQTDERDHVAANLAKIGTILGLVGFGLTRTPLAPAAPIIGGAEVVIGGLGQLVTIGRAVVDDNQSSKIRSQIKHYQGIYAREAAYRQREA